MCSRLADTTRLGAAIQSHLETRLMTVESPCINECILNSDGYCKGCKRSREEIIEWSEMSDDAKAYICTQLSTRNI